MPIVENFFDDIEISGSWIVIRDVHVRSDPPGLEHACRDQPAGQRFGIRFLPGAHDDVAQDSLVTELYSGVRIDLGASRIKVIHNVFRDNNMKNPDPKSDAGATAIDVHGDDNAISYNTISGSVTCSPFFGGWDGSAVSIFQGQHNVIDHNVSSQNHAFIEIGDPRSADTLIAYNSDHSDLVNANFLVVHGVGSRYGVTHGTRAYHNTTVLTQPDAGAILCAGDVDARILSLRDNIIWSNGRIGTSRIPFDEGGNIYWSSNGQPDFQMPVSPDSLVVDPRLVDAVGGDFHLEPDSPAIDGAGADDMGAPGAVDQAGVPVPQGAAPDIGAYEFPAPGATSGATPTATPGTSEIPGLSPTIPGPTSPPGTAIPSGPKATSSPLPTVRPKPTDVPPQSGAGGVSWEVLVGIGLGVAVLIVILRRRPAG